VGIAKADRRRIKPRKIALLCPAFILFWSCASTGSFMDIDIALAQSRYSDGVVRLETKKNTLYSDRDAVLYNLDKGILCHYAELYDESSMLLAEAERAIEEAFTKSVSQEISSYLVNDNTRDYSGEDYEDIYINVFNALNYYHRGKIEGSLVEIRRMNNKLQNLTNKYDTEISNLQKKALEENKNQLPSNPNAPSHFSDSAFARYLGMLFYRAAGLHDDARIDRDYLLAACANAPSVYRHPVPSSVSEEMVIPGGMARLNVIAFGGLSPIKIEVVPRILIRDDRWIKVAYPVMESRPSAISKVTLVMDGGGDFEFELLEDMDAVAKETFKTRQQVIYLKTMIRAILKSVSSTALDAVARETSGNESLVFGLLGLTAQVFAEVSEQADIRVSRFFPARAYVGGINLSPGTYSFTVHYYNSNGHEIASVRHENMEVKENALNLAEAVCFR
jgi:hypothetical protein